MVDHLWHVTLTTGHVRLSHRSEVGDGVVEIVRPLLSGRHTVPGHPDLMLRRLPFGDSHAPPVWQIDKDDFPVVTFGLAVSEADVGVLRESLGMSLGPVEYPWLVVVLRDGLSLCTPSEALVLGDLERCLAWSWLERPVAHDGQNRIQGPWPWASPTKGSGRRKRKGRGR